MLLSNQYNGFNRETLPDYISDTHSSIQCSAKNGRGMLDILETIANFRDVMASKTTQSKTAEPIEEEKEKAESILKEY